MIGLAGAHRTGKTTLARAWCDAHPVYTFLPTDLSSVFRDCGITPKENMPFKERLEIQNLLLDKCERVYESGNNSILTITDRTPFDVLAYTLAEVTRTTLHGEKALTDAYYDHVFRAEDLSERYISSAVVVQPGIEIVEEEGKAPGCEVYIDHLNILIVNMISNFYPEGLKGIIPRNVTELATRASFLEHFSKRSVEAHLHEAEIHGGARQ